MKGSIGLFELDSPALVGNALADPSRRSCPVYLPPGYAGGRDRLPAIYFLHGFTGSGAGWLNTSAWVPTVPERIDRLIDSGSIPPFIGFFLDGWTRLGGSQWINSSAIGSYRDYVAKDVVAWADATFRTLPAANSRAVVGKSSGGFGALVMGRHHPDVFGHVGCHSGDAGFEYCYLPDFPKAASALLEAGGVEPWFRGFLHRASSTRLRGDDHAVINAVAMAAAYSPKAGEPLGLELPFEVETARLRPEVWERWLAFDPVRFVPQSLGAFRALSSVFLDCGTRDEANLRWGARMVKQALEQAGVEVVHEEFDAGHMGINFRYDRSLSYLAPRLKRE